MSHTGDSKFLDGRNVRLADPELGVGKQKNNIRLDAAIALRGIGAAAFLVAVFYSTLLYTRRPYGKHHLPGLVDFVPGLCCQYGSTMALTIFNKINKRDEDVAPPSNVWRDRLFLLLGFALMTGGLVGSISILFLKQYVYFGYANVFHCITIIISLAIVLVAKGHI